VAGRTAGQAGQGRAGQARAEHRREDVERTSRRLNSYEARLILTAADGYCFQQWSQGSRFICQVAARPGSQVARRSARGVAGRRCWVAVVLPTRAALLFDLATRAS
jgi:hypothetical protein